MGGLSPWVAAARKIFSDANIHHVYRKQNKGFEVNIHSDGSSLWAMLHWSGNARLALRLAYSPAVDLVVDELTEKDDGIRLTLISAIGKFEVSLQIYEDESPVVRYTCFLEPAEDLLIPYWPRDIIVLDKNDEPKGEIHASQVGVRSGLQYFTIKKPKAGSVLYFQNLTAINDYCEQTKTSLKDTVGGQWPELGFGLPPAIEQPVKKGNRTTLSDAFITFGHDAPEDEFAMARQFLDLLALVYLRIPQPETRYCDWPAILEKTLYDIKHNAGCWMQADGHSYLNAYVSDYTTPPEIMVQLAVLLPLIDYTTWKKMDMPLIQQIKAGLDRFYEDMPGSVVRWLPAMQDMLKGGEEHKRPRVMDSWYLHHPLLNLSRLAIEHKDKMARKLFLGSMDFVIKVAHHFNYDWPVFYNIDTLEVIKAETQPGKGGEQDVPCTYALVMLQAYELTSEKRYLDEAKKAAGALKGKGLKLFYQANNTAFGAKAMIRLWKMTKQKQYLELSYLCIANLFVNMWLWDCTYGNGKHYPTFFGVFPLSDAPYLAVYEEQEVFSSFIEYLQLAKDENIPRSISLLLAEFVRHMMYRGAFYYPPQLPKEVLVEKPKTGEMSKGLWIPIEDIHDGHEQSGEVGQEVYGAGFAFGLTSSQYFHVPGEEFMIYIDYPIMDFSKSGQTVRFSVKGDSRMTCRLRIIPGKNQVLPVLQLSGAQQNNNNPIEGKKMSSGHIEYIVNGGQQLQLKWKKHKEVNGYKVKRHKPAMDTSSN